MDQKTKEFIDIAEKIGFHLDISRAKDLIGYEPQYELKEGLKKYYDWIRQYSS